jgi:hypothetical protein
VRRRLARGFTEENMQKRHGFWPLRRTPLSPSRVFAWLFQEARELQEKREYLKEIITREA